MQGAGASHDSWTAALRPAAWQQRMPQEARGRASRNSSTSSRSPAQQPAGSGSASPSSGGAARAPAQRVAAVHAQRLAFLRGARTGRRCRQGAWRGSHGSPAAACGGRRWPGPAAFGLCRAGQPAQLERAVSGSTPSARGAADQRRPRAAARRPRRRRARRRARRPPSSQPWQASPAAHRWSWRPLGRPRAGQRRTGGHLSVRGASRRGGRPLGIGVGDQQRRHGAKARGLGHAGQDARGLQAALLRRGGKRVWPPAVVTLQSAQACGSSPACRARADSSPAPSGSCCSCSRPGSAGSASPAAR